MARRLKNKALGAYSPGKKVLFLDFLAVLAVVNNIGDALIAALVFGGVARVRVADAVALGVVVGPFDIINHVVTDAFLRVVIRIFYFTEARCRDS